MTLSRWHVVVVLALVLFLIAALVLGDEGSDAVLNQTEGGQRGATLDAGRGTRDFWANAADIATVATAFATIVATIGGLFLLTVAYRQLRLSANTTRGDFWLRLREMFEAQGHKDVHLNLMPGGDWWDTGDPPDQPILAGQVERVQTELEEKGDKYEVPWAKDKVVKKDEKLFVVPWSGVKHEAESIENLTEFYMYLKGPQGTEWRNVEAYMGLEAAPIGGQLFAHDISQRDCTAF